MFVTNYDVDKEYDELYSVMRSFYVSPYNIRKALNILSNYNTGMCVSVDDIRMSVIFVSKATNKSEFWNTCLHELRHVAQAILDYYGADFGEDDAYLTGYLTKELVEIIGEPCK